jgi:(p)ppGpp synthase/HD superfamily hydrolase
MAQKGRLPVANHDNNPEVAAAKAIATIAHRSQIGQDRRAVHRASRRVAARLNEPKHIAAAWLHDVIEDCGITARIWQLPVSATR